MKKLLLLFFIVYNVFAFAQQKQFSIQWDGTRILETPTFQVELPAFNKENFSYSDSEGLFYVSQWEINTLLNEKSLTLSNVSYVTMSSNDLKALSKDLIPNAPKVKLSNSVDRNKISAFLKISPIINDNGVFKKITSFTINYSSGSSAVNRNAANTQEIVNSVLSTGKWRRFYVDKSGIFKLSKSFLEDIGVNTSADPRSIKIFGNGGAIVPMPNNEFYPNDLAENAIQFVGEEDGVFNDGDYILFYAEGPTGNVEESDINTNINPYTNKTNYYVNFGGDFGKRIETTIQPNENPDFTVNTFQDYKFHEVDEYNVVKLGRRWFGDRFDIENEKTFTFNFPNLVTTEPAKLKVYGATVSEVPTTMSVKVNSADVANLNFNGVSDGVLGTGASYEGNLLLNSSEVAVNLQYNNNGNPSSLGYLDYVSVEATRDLSFTGGQMHFKNNIVQNTSGVVEYLMSNTSNVKEVWDITDKYNVTSISNPDQVSNFSFKAVSGTLRHYIAFNNQNFFEPLRDANTFVSNQNIKGTIFLNNQGEFQDIDYIIVTPNNMLSQAERLAEINRQQYDLNVKVVTLKQIYTEFSSGNQDIGGIRNMIKYVYHNASVPDKRLKYLCLFGDASFDYKNRITNNTNIVPSWFSYNSFSLTSSFVSDDFYVMMDDNEGTMEASNKADIAVGRILANSPQQAKQLVDKIQEYYSVDSYGSWRNNVLVISDDVDIGSFEGELQQTTDDIANIITQEKPFLNAIKIHSDAFLQESSSAGERYPQVNKEIRDAIEVGALVVNYFGHGGEDGLAAERIFDKIDSQEVSNACKYNLFITVTCEYTKFDDPLRHTAGEFTYWNTKGGAIGLVTTTRQIFVSLGQAFNVIMEPYLFAFGSNDYPSVAEALRQSKNDPSISSNPQKPLVWYIGDPAMKLSFAKPDVRLTKINDVPIGGDTDVLQALGKVKLSGEVVNESGNLLSDYNGILTATIFDKEIERQTLNNDNQTNNGQPVVMDFKTLGEVIFKGQATVANGEFEFEFVVPKDIGIPVGPGKVSFYTMRTLPLENRAGSSFDIQVGGINENAAEDNIGPVINLYMNDENFVSGGITNEQPSLVAKLQDENGINTASGIGHDIVAILDGDETNPFVLNDYYQADIDDYQNGKVSYPFRDLSPGLHTLSLKAWDVYNNSSTAEIEFIVFDKDQELIIDNVLNYPNPFIDYTEFWFNHNSSDVLDVSVQIFTVSGKLVRTLNGQTNGGSKVTSSISKDIVWDGRDDFGDKIGKGVYIYKLKVRSNRLNKQVEKIEKLVIL
ncbi:type IX secretion system sortase PorU [Psychroserpens ponticola]|uniref:Type IX secretion system sortase PorU n=1 Tax=Psychroserpens ponticola TaxID=2932268 RepID=A0ABY7RV88_9FLAO|nr:type IX secretion system sortase PorU [Psychroserpens ponticola]WCO01014.1 type IX secretion system sortase PorU [Psychroserpens ponticola]